jgi:hypothetical protein
MSQSARRILLRPATCDLRQAVFSRRFGIALSLSPGYCATASYSPMTTRANPIVSAFCQLIVASAQPRVDMLRLCYNQHGTWLIHVARNRYTLGCTHWALSAFGSPSTGSGTAVRHYSSVYDFSRVARKIVHKGSASTLLPSILSLSKPRPERVEGGRQKLRHWDAQ